MMKHKHSTFLFAIIVTVFFSCKNDNRQITADLINFPENGSEANADGPMISFDSMTCNFGKIAVGEKILHSFRFTNTGKSPLLIGQVTPSCGCTTAKDWPQTPVMPGESGQITVELNSQGLNGQVVKTITVITNCLPKVWDLKLTGEVAGLAVSPEQQNFEMEMERK